MKKCIICLIFLTVIVNYLYSFDQSKDEIQRGNFYFLIGTEGNERAIMYLHILGTNAYGSYYTENQEVEKPDGYNDYDDGSFNGTFNGRNLNLEYIYYDNTGNRMKKTITGSLSGDIVFKGKHNSKNINLSLANTLVNSAYIEQEENWYSSSKKLKFTFNIRKLNNLDYYDEIVYIDENIIIFYAFVAHGLHFATYSIHTGKEIKPSDFISNSFLERYKAEINYGFLGYRTINLSNYSFSITPYGKIIFLYDYGRVYDEESGYYATSGPDYLVFTFDEIKPFIKKGSILEYLFN